MPDPPPTDGPAALTRLALAFPRPAEPMGEAWFLGSDRRMFTELLGDLTAAPPRAVEDALVEIVAGLSCFGPYPEWVEWYHHLLPRAAGAHATAERVELLTTGLMVLYPARDGDFPYDNFLADALAALEHAAASLPADAAVRHPEGLLSACFFLRARYLDPGSAECWFRAVVAAPDPAWRKRVAAWLVGANPVLEEDRWPADLPLSGAFDATWEWSHALGRGGSAAPFLPDDNRRALLGVVHDARAGGALLRGTEASDLTLEYARLYGGA